MVKDRERENASAIGGMRYCRDSFRKVPGSKFAGEAVNQLPTIMVSHPAVMDMVEKNLENKEPELIPDLIINKLRWAICFLPPNPSAVPDKTCVASTPLCAEIFILG